ncbi:MAG TPA: ABC transporter permease [Egibacteraceae bacterium]
MSRGFPDWAWFNDRNLDRVVDLLLQHLQLTVLALLLGIVIATPLGVLAVRRRRLYTPLLALTGVLFTIPSVALFIVLLAFAGTGLGLATPLIGLTIYTLLILFRNTVAGLDGVPRDVIEAAEAMGYRPLRRLLTVELPLALPVYVAGVRIATVTTIGLVTITAFVGWGGLGQLFITGFQRQNPTEISVGLVLCIVLAVAADLLLVAAQRWLTPWSQARA